MTYEPTPDERRAAGELLDQLEATRLPSTLLATALAEAREAGRREALDGMSIALGTAEHALDELTGDVDLVRFVIDELKGRGVTNP